MNPRYFLILTGVAIAIAVFSCGVQRSQTEDASGVTMEKLEEPPLRKSTLIGRNTKPAFQNGEVGPKGPFSEFQRLTSETLEHLPMIEQVRKNPDFDPTFTPPDLMASAPSLGQIATAMRENPELVPAGIDFYADCAKREGAMIAVRVLCLRNLRHWAKQQPDILEFDSSDFPEDIWKIADSLPPIR